MDDAKEEQLQIYIPIIMTRELNAIPVKTVTDPIVLDQGRVFNEAQAQTEPLAKPGTSEAAKASAAVADGTARTRGLRPETCESMVQTKRDIQSFAKGARPVGKAAEIVATHDYKLLHEGNSTGIINPPNNVSPNVIDIRISPDDASKRDLVFIIKTDKGNLYISNGQVKVGSPAYVSSSLIEMANSSDYGKVGYVDAKFVNPDGTPRVAPDAFTETQAAKLKAAGVRLRGIPDLKRRAEELYRDILLFGEDGFDPVKRAQMTQLRRDIARAYSVRGIAGRFVSSAALAVTLATIGIMASQAIRGEEIDFKVFGVKAGQSTLVTAGTVAFDSAVYHGVVRSGQPVEVAKAIADRTVVIGGTLFAIGADIYYEFRAARNGDISIGDAIVGSIVKSDLNLLPLALISFGVAGVAISIAAQIFVRWGLASLRNTEQELNKRFVEDLHFADIMVTRLQNTNSRTRELLAKCAEADKIFLAAIQT